MGMACDANGCGRTSITAGSVTTNTPNVGCLEVGDPIPFVKPSDGFIEDPTTVRLKRRLRTNSEETALILTSMSQGFTPGDVSVSCDVSTHFNTDTFQPGDVNESSCDEHESNMNTDLFASMSRLPTVDKMTPRNSSESNRSKSLVTKHISIDELRAHFDRPIIDVAKEFGICITLMKKICRRNGIKRWPHRQIRSLSKSIASMEAAMLSAQGAEREKYSSQIANLKQKREAVISDPNKENSSRVKTNYSVDTYTNMSPKTALVFSNTASINSVTPPESIERGVSPSGSKGGRWTSDEHASFLEGIRLYGKDWRRVAQVVGTRSAVQTRTHAQKYLLKFAGRFPFDPDGAKEEEEEQKFSYGGGDSSTMSQATNHAYPPISNTSSINGVPLLINNGSQRAVPSLLHKATESLVLADAQIVPPMKADLVTDEI